MTFRDEESDDEQDLGDTVPEAESRASGAPDILVACEGLNQILRAIFTLAEESSRLVVLVDVMQASLEEAALEVGLSVRAVSRSLWRSHKTLRKLLRQEGIDPWRRTWAVSASEGPLKSPGSGADPT